MCGICGSVAFSGLPDPEATHARVDAMLQALSHRGPDAVGRVTTDSHRPLARSHERANVVEC